MRKRFEQQTTLGKILIEDVEIPLEKRNGPLPSLCAALKEIFTNPKWNKQVFDILEEKVFPKNNGTGRPGMDLWAIFVLAQVRNCENISYDRLHYLANHDKLVRRIMGIETEFGVEEVKLKYQTVIDNTALLDHETIEKINGVIVRLGHETFKKKEGGLRLKTDSFVVESNVHFPTDYNLLWDCIRKSLDMIDKLGAMRSIQGWRKSKHWRRSLKNGSRSLGRASASGGKNKQERIRNAARAYLSKSKSLYDKLVEARKSLSIVKLEEIKPVFALDEYIKLMDKHIDLVERRLLKGETIPHEEKMFSIFETYTEWMNKGKKRPGVELGKNTAITSDQWDLIVDHRTMEHQTDSEVVPALAADISSRHLLKSWSFDKGFWSKSNKKLLLPRVDLLVLPKKGKCNKTEAGEEHSPSFKKQRNLHSAVESNINELEHRGLDRCPDRGYSHFKRYVGLAVCSYNLKKIGEKLIEERRKREKPPERKAA